MAEKFAASGTDSIYITVENLDETLAKVTENGGRICQSPVEIENVGRMAVVADPQGAVFSLMQYSMKF